MERLKPESEFLKPDPRSFTPLATRYEGLQSCELHAGVPGWFYYPFYTFAHFLALTGVEMALNPA